MNLTKPPPVEKLDPAYAEEVRRNLVRGTYKAQRPPKWVPAVAAACGIAVITTGVVLLSRTGDHSSPGPAASTSPTTPTATVVQLAPEKSARVSLDLGHATASEARAAARECLADLRTRDGSAPPAKPEDADTATLRQARWIKTMAGAQPPPRILMQTFTTAKGDWVQCLGDELVMASPSRKAGLAGVNPADPVLGDWKLQQVSRAGSPLLFAEYSFVTLPNVVRMELRIRWTGGASPWYGVTFSDGAGYIAASQLGAVFKRGEMEIDVRAFDTAGKQVYSDTEYG